MELKDTIQGMTSEDYKERFIAEYQQLVIRTKRLERILFAIEEKKTPDCFTPTCPIGLLYEQYLNMAKYLVVLETRAKFENIKLEEVTI